MNAVLAAELNERRAGVMFSEDRDDLRLGEARIAHMSFLFGLSAGETHDFKWPGLPGQRQVHMAHACAELTGKNGRRGGNRKHRRHQTVTAIANASIAGVPVLLIGGCPPRTQVIRICELQFSLSEIKQLSLPISPDLNLHAATYRINAILAYDLQMSKTQRFLVN